MKDIALGPGNSHILYLLLETFSAFLYNLVGFKEDCMVAPFSHISYVLGADSDFSPHAILARSGRSDRSRRELPIFISVGIYHILIVIYQFTQTSATSNHP